MIKTKMSSRLLTTLIISIGACYNVGKTNTFDFSHIIEGRNYYLLEDGFTCRANAPKRPILKSWKNHIGFNNNEILIWETICNDNPTIKPFNINNFSFSKDLSSFIYQSEKYMFYEVPPKLCSEGQWCPISK